MRSGRGSQRKVVQLSSTPSPCCRSRRYPSRSFEVFTEAKEELTIIKIRTASMNFIVLQASGRVAEEDEDERRAFRTYRDRELENYGQTLSSSTPL
ncbi:hypothetical protein ACFX12_019342 [Malus domestica]